MSDDKEARKREAEERGIKFEEDEEEDEQVIRKKKKIRVEESSEDDNDDEEEDDDEEDEDEEDSDDDLKGSSSKKRKKKNINRFFVDEASEGSSDDDDYEGEGEAGEVEDTLTPAEIARRNERLEQERQFQARGAEELAVEYEQRYRANVQMSKGSGSTFSGAATIETARLMRERPRTDDAKLFLVKCRPGMEKELVVKIYSKYIINKFKRPETVDPNMPKSRWAVAAAPGSELEVFTVLAPGTTGSIYVESRREECVKAAIRGISGVFAGRISIVPLEEMQDVLRVELRKDSIKEGDYVRLSTPALYKGDLALVDKIREGGSKATVKIVPRINFSTLSMEYSKNSARPPAKLFNPDEIRAAGGAPSRETFGNDQVDAFDSNYFSAGLLFLDVPMRALKGGNVNPTVEELSNFVQTSKSSKSAGDDVTAIAEEIQRTMTKQKVVHFDFAVGDRVLVIAGSETGLEGTLENIDLYRAIGTLKYRAKDNREIVIDARLKDMVKQFTVGDHVKVIAGKHSGKSGNVVSTSSLVSKDVKPYVLVYTDSTGEEIQVFNADLKLSTEVSVGLDSLNGYRLFDLVMLDQNLHGVIVRINSDSVRILNHNHEVKDVATTAIRAKKNAESKHSTTPDSTGHSLSENDHVIVMNGPYKGSEGVVKHLYRALLFVHCKAREHENLGMIVVKAKDSKIAGTLQQQRPNAANAWGSKPANGAGGRAGGTGHVKDQLHGKSVRIIRGNDKGLVGTVVEGGSATLVRVELNARNKVITIKREDVVEVTPKFTVEAPQVLPEEFRGGGGGGGGYGYGYGGGQQASAPFPATPGFDMSQQRPLGGQGQQGDGGMGLVPFQKHDKVKLIDSGEEVTVYEVIGRDLAVKTSGNKVKVVSASNVVYA